MSRSTKEAADNLLSGELVSSRPKALEKGFQRRTHLREDLREQCLESLQLESLIKEIDDLTSLRKEISRRKTSGFDKSATAKYKLLHENYRITMDRRLSIINKLLADDKEVVIDEGAGSIPSLKLTIVNS